LTPDQVSAYAKLALKLLPWLGLFLGVIFVIMGEVVPSPRDRKPLRAIGVVMSGASLGALIALLMG
jgi:hypothetical protein